MSEEQERWMIPFPIDKSAVMYLRELADRVEKGEFAIQDFSTSDGFAHDAADRRFRQRSEINLVVLYNPKRDEDVWG